MSRVLAPVSVLWLAVCCGCASQSPDALRTEVQQVIRTYLDANNKPDVTAMMEMVSRTEGVSMVNNGDITRGWDAIRTFNDGVVSPSAPGFSMALGSIDVRPLGDRSALVLAPVTLTFAGATDAETTERTGALTFVLEKSDKGWKIVHQHLSLVPEAGGD